MIDGEKSLAYRECERVTRRWSTSYAAAIRFFPRDVARATNALYAFARTADNFVDQKKPDAVGLAEHRMLWKQAYDTGRSEHPILFATSDVFHRYDIPYELSEQFLDTMHSDSVVKRYNRYRDLATYMDGSAGTVGMMMAHVVGYSDKAALRYASVLGHALQLTNFLRDVREDVDEYGRIYLPLEDLERHGVVEQDIIEKRVTMPFRYFMHSYVRKNRDLYREARVGIPLLYSRGRAAVSLAASMYEELLHEIERNDYDVFRVRASVPTWKKGVLALSAAGSAALGRLSF